LDLSIITPDILVGTQVLDDRDFQLLANLGVQGIFSLQSDDDLNRAGIRFPVMESLAAARGMEYLRCPIQDFDPEAVVAKLEGCVRILDELLGNHERVYVHCTAGVNRSVGVVLAYLVLQRDMDVARAYGLVKSRRPQASPYRLVMEFLNRKLTERHRQG
jgi:protein-tyrosine phosphatase